MWRAWKRRTRFFKKSLGVLRGETVEVKYAMIRRHEEEHTIALMCGLLSVSRGGYYDWRDRPTPPRTKADESLIQARGATGGEEPSGPPYAPKRPTGQGRPQVQGDDPLRAQLAYSPNLLNQDFSAQRPNQKWVSDITYLATDEGWLYSRRGARPLHPQSRGLGHVRTDDGETHL